MHELRGGGDLLQPDIKTPHMALTVHVDIVRRTGLAIPKILDFFFFSDNTLALYYSFKKKIGRKKNKKQLNSILP